MKEKQIVGILDCFFLFFFFFFLGGDGLCYIDFLMIDGSFRYDGSISVNDGSCTFPH